MENIIDFIEEYVPTDCRGEAKKVLRKMLGEELVNAHLKGFTGVDPVKYIDILRQRLKYLFNE